MPHCSTHHMLSSQQLGTLLILLLNVVDSSSEARPAFVLPASKCIPHLRVLLSSHKILSNFCGISFQPVLMCSFVIVQSLTRVWFFVTPWTAAHQASLSLAISWSLLNLMSAESVMPSNHLTLCCPLLLPSSIFPSVTVFSNESALYIRWPKYWSISFSISPSNEYSRLLSFRIDWFDLLVIQGTLKNLLQHHSLKALILWCSAFFMVQLSLLEKL